MIKRLRALARYRSMKWNITIAFSLLLFFSVNAAGYLSYYKFSQGAEENAKNYTFDIASQISNNVDYYIQYMEDISTLTYFNKNIQNYLGRPADSLNYSEHIRRTMEKAEILEYFNSFLSIRQDIVSLYIFGNDGEVLTNRPNASIKAHIEISEQPWYKQAMEADGSVVVSPTHVRNIMQDDYEWVVSLSRKIKHLDTKATLGVFLIDLNFKVIHELCQKIKFGSKSGYVFIVDPNGELVYHPQQQLIYSNIKNEDFALIMNTDDKFVTSDISGREKLYTISTSDHTGWKIVGVTYTDELVPNKAAYQRFIIMLSMVSLPLTLLLATFVASRISSPIKRLEADMRQVEKGLLDIQVNIEGNREVAQLSRTFQMMLKRIRALMQQVYVEQDLKRRIELKALQAQINPHFLYNSLDLAIWMTQAGKTEEVIQLISSLAKLFRTSISSGEEWITVKDEIEHVKSYLLIQKLRYKEKINFVFDVEQAVLRCKMPRLILQPLVENAIYHGIKPSSANGYICIRGYMDRVGEDSALILEISDNGVGIPPDKLAHIYDGISSKLQEGGVGIKNIQDRIRLYAGERHGLQFQSAVGSGTTVRVNLPIAAKENNR